MGEKSSEVHDKEALVHVRNYFGAPEILFERIVMTLKIWS